MAEQTPKKIVSSDGTHGGRPRIEGTRVTVGRVKALVEDRGVNAREVAELLDVGIADVYRALTYYHDHEEEMRALREREGRRVEDALDEGGKTLAELRSDDGG